MKQTVLILLLIPLLFFGCEEKEAPETSKRICSPGTQHYLSGMVLGKELCWEEKKPVTFRSTGTGTCGKGYENIPNKYMAMEVVIAEYEGTKLERSISIALPFECDAYSTKEKFFFTYSPSATSMVLHKQAITMGNLLSPIRMLMEVTHLAITVPRVAIMLKFFTLIRLPIQEVR